MYIYHTYTHTHPHTHTHIPRCILFWSGPRQYISLLLGDRVCFIARILYMRTTGVLKIVKSVSRVLKTEAVFIYVAKGDEKKRGKREGKNVYYKFHLPTTRCSNARWNPFDFNVHYVLRRGTRSPRAYQCTPPPEYRRLQ